jgi:hypothetical protein
VSATTIEQERVLESVGLAMSDEQLIANLVDRARGEGLQLTGEGGLLQRPTMRALKGEITDHVGREKHDPARKNSGNSRYGTRTKQCCPKSARSRSEFPGTWPGPVRVAFASRATHTNSATAAIWGFFFN